MIKFSMFKNWETLRSLHNQVKDFGELDDKLIIQHFHYSYYDIYNVFFKF